jgi:ketosteroid isomerase-like protein
MREEHQSTAQPHRLVPPSRVADCTSRDGLEQQYSADMSQENAELVRRLYQSFNEGTADELVPDHWHEDAELRPAILGGGLLEGAVYRGHEGVLEFLAIQAETWERVTNEPLDIRDLGTYLLAETRLQAVGRASGIELSQVTWDRWEIRNGKVASLRVFTEQAEALEAVGLSE